MLVPEHLSLASFLNARVLRRVVFPAPLAPMIAMNWPGSTMPDTKEIIELMLSFLDRSRNESLNTLGYSISNW